MSIEQELEKEALRNLRKLNWISEEQYQKKMAVLSVNDKPIEWCKVNIYEAMSKIPPKIDRAENNIDSIDKGE